MTNWVSPGSQSPSGNALESLESRWSLRLLQFPTDSPLTPALREQLEPSRVRAGGGRPMLRLPEDRPPQRMLTANTRAAVAKARNRIRREGRRLEVEWLTAWSPIEAVLPEVVAIHRARDLELRGRTLLDDPQEADSYQEVLVRHAQHWRLLAVRIDGALAGYALCLADGRVLRVWDNRLSPDWRRYSAGLIANAEVVVSAGQDPAIHEVDWGLGISATRRECPTR